MLLAVLLAAHGDGVVVVKLVGYAVVVTLTLVTLWLHAEAGYTVVTLCVARWS